MANFVYTTAKKGLMNGTIDLDTDDIRALLVLSNSTCDTEEDKTFLDQFTTLDEAQAGGGSYARQALTGEAVAADDANDRGEFTSDAITFTAVVEQARDIIGMVLYKFVNDDTDSIPIAFIDDDAPYNPGGGDVVYTPKAEGWLQLT